MIVKAAMGEPRGVHQFGDAHSLKSTLPEELRRRGDDPALVVFRPGSADFHGHPLRDLTR
jgi:hypothetical protein